VFLYPSGDKYFIFRPLLQKKEGLPANLFLIQTLQIPFPLPLPQGFAGILLYQGVDLCFILITLNTDTNENTWHLFPVEM
jgi:hypothetical protein